MRLSVIGWELPPIFSGGLGVHTINIFSIINKMIDVTVYVPDIEGLSDEYPFNVKKIKFNTENLNKYIDNQNKKSENKNYYNIYPYYNNLKIKNINFNNFDFKDFNEMIYYYNKSVIECFDRNTDVIHCHDWITFDAGVELKEKYGVPLVITVHSTEIDRSGNFFPQKYIMDIEKRGIKNADKIIAVSDYTKNMIIDNYDADKDKITVVYNGIDSDFIDTAYKDYNLHKNILYFGRVTTQKGPKFFLEAAEKVIKYFPDVKFIIAGTGDLINDMKVLAKELKIENNVIFTGFISLNNKIKYFKDADVFVLPAVSEPFGISVIEAMGMGIPTVISNTTGVGEALYNVFKCDFYDTDLMAEYIIGLLKHQGLRETMGANGQIEARKFTWNNAAIKTMGVYKSIFEGVKHE